MPVEQLASDEPFEAARGVADAVLYEGYLLYPYRRSSAKNRVRWQFGVLTPEAWIDEQGVPDPGIAGSAESWFQQVECLAEAPGHATVHVRVRFLQAQRKQAYQDADGRVPVDRIVTDDRIELSFDEAVPQEFDLRFGLAELLDGEREVPLTVPGERTVEYLASGSLERTSEPLHARLVARADPATAPFRLHRLHVRIENAAGLVDPTVARDVVLRDSLLATHLLLGLDNGRFLSAIDPPAWAAEASRACVNQHVFPVLAGAADGDDVLLCAPIILPDHPQVAPESPADLHDATEIDEILSLRTLTLTDAEKAEARATDPRAAAIVDRVDAMPPELLARLHGALRDLPPAGHPDVSDTVLVDGAPVSVGSTVRLRPAGRGADAHDMFFAGRLGHVHEILHDVDGTVRLGVTVDGDPAAELHEWYGRLFHFSPHEVSPA